MNTSRPAWIAELWGSPPEDVSDLTQRVWIEMRIDVRLPLVPVAQRLLQLDDWSLASQPDEANDPIQRLYFRRFQSFEPDQVEAMLAAGYRASEAGEGRFWSWIVLEDEEQQS